MHDLSDSEVVTMPSTRELIEHARQKSGLSQRDLAAATGISQPTLSRIISGERVAKVPEFVAIAAATGHTLAELTGHSRVAERAQSAARAISWASMEAMGRELLHYLELDAYLDEQGIPAGGGLYGRSRNRSRQAWSFRFSD
jgi:transcriptional regulator with XRE-family HTH domain